MYHVREIVGPALRRCGFA